MRPIKRFTFQTYRKWCACVFVLNFKFSILLTFFTRQTTSQDKVQELFVKYGSILNFKWIIKEGNKMALIEMSTLEEAVLSLIVSWNLGLIFVLNIHSSNVFILTLLLGIAQLSIKWLLSKS